MTKLQVAMPYSKQELLDVLTEELKKTREFQKDFLKNMKGGLSFGGDDDPYYVAMRQRSIVEGMESGGKFIIDKIFGEEQ